MSLAEQPLGFRRSYSFTCGCGNTEERTGFFATNGNYMGTRPTICRQCKWKRARIADRERKRAKGAKPLVIFWTPERIAKAKELWRSGLSGSEVGKHFGVSRSAALGILGRKGALGERSKNKRTESQKKASHRERMRRYRAKVKLFIRPKVRDWSTVNLPVAGALPPLNHTILEVTGCRYIAGSDHLFCGHPQQQDSSYCPAHHVETHRRPD
jgi:hypothetical protein